MAAATLRPKSPIDRLLGMPRDRFMRKHWQRAPLFVKGAIDPDRLSVPSRDLEALAKSEVCESRLVVRERGQWRLLHGPFPELPKAKRAWTVLVQGVNLHDARADAVLDDFRWLPHARLDDVMISVAADGGGVGPHFDSYDVFLIQASGRRRWRISSQRDLALVDNAPLKLLADFRPEAEFVCEPGDLLYLPPQYAHDGVAMGACTTWSIGFRAPTHTELLRGYLESRADEVDLPGRYADRGLAVPLRPAEVPQGFVDTLEMLRQRVRFTRDDAALWLGEYLSEPKPNVVFDVASRSAPRARWLIRAERAGIALDRRSAMLHDARRVFINGLSFDASGADGKTLRKLADARRLQGADVASATAAVREVLFGWYRDGWLDVDGSPPTHP